MPPNPTPARSARTDGLAAIRTANAARLAAGPLLPWQSYALARALEVGPHGYAFQRVGLVVGRGNGKSVWIAARILHALDRGQSVIGMAQRLEVAKDSFDQVAAALERHPRLAGRVRRVFTGIGMARIEVAGPRGGLATYRIATTEKACRGPRAQLVVVDEAALVGEDVFHAALGMMQGTGLSGDKQVCLVSSAGSVSSAILNRYRDDAAAGAPDLLWLHYGAPDGCDPGDESLWPSAIPALGWRTSLDDVRMARAAMPPHVFATEVLSAWADTTADPVIAPAAWAAAQDPQLRAPRPGPVLGVAASKDRANASVGIAWHDPDGALRIGVKWTGKGPDLKAAATRQRAETGAPVWFDAWTAGPAASGTPWSAVTARQLGAATAHLLEQSAAGLLRVRPDAALDAALAGATLRDMAGGSGQALDRRDPAANITPLDAVLVAVAGLLDKRPDPVMA